MNDRLNFTRKNIEAISLPDSGRTYVHDERVNGLVLQVTANGAKSFQVYRKVGGRPVRVTLGKYPDLTIEQARKAGIEALGKLAGGVNPNAEKQRVRLAAKLLKEVFAEYLEVRKDLKPRTRTDMASAFREVFPDWSDKPVAKITPLMIEKRHRTHGEERSKARSNLAMRYLRALFNFAQAHYQDDDGKPLIEANPVKTLSQKRAWFRVDRRKTLIKAHELAAWWKAVEEQGNPTLLDYFQFVLLTGVRRKEASLLKWPDVDLLSRTFTVLDPKNHQDHTLPLSDYLLDLLTRRKAEAVNEYVFTDRKGNLPQNPQKAQARILQASGVSFCIHDLRRTFATIAESLDISSYALKRLLNHASGGDVTSGYLIITPERLRGPMQKITDYVLKVAGVTPGADIISILKTR